MTTWIFQFRKLYLLTCFLSEYEFNYKGSISILQYYNDYLEKNPKALVLPGLVGFSVDF